MESDFYGDGFRIIRNGRFVRLETDDNVVVENDGEWTALVKIPAIYKNAMTGLCGNYDDNPDNDLTTSDGQDVSGMENQYSLVGNSWQVDDSEDTT